MHVFLTEIGCCESSGQALMAGSCRLFLRLKHVVKAALLRNIFQPELFCDLGFAAVALDGACQANLATASNNGDRSILCSETFCQPYGRRPALQLSLQLFDSLLHVAWHSWCHSFREGQRTVFHTRLTTCQVWMHNVQLCSGRYYTQPGHQLCKGIWHPVSG